VTTPGTARSCSRRRPRASGPSTATRSTSSDRVDVGGVARHPDPRLDRELAGSDAALVFAGSEAHPLFIIRA
jgi:hypothetical protein